MKLIYVAISRNFTIEYLLKFHFFFQTNLEKSNKPKSANEDPIYVNFVNTRNDVYFQIRSKLTKNIAVGSNGAEQFLNCLNDSLTFSKDLKPVDPDNINDGVLYR